MPDLFRNVSNACRGLWRAPGATIPAVLVLAVGIGSMTVMTALVYGVLLRPLPVRAQDRLIVAWKELRSGAYAHVPFGDADIRRVARSSRLLDRVAGVGRNGVSPIAISENGAARYANEALVTGGFFDVLDVRPVLGRTLTRADDLDGAERVVVISHGLWQRRYGGSPDAIGRRLTLGEQPFRIVGVIPPDLDYPQGAELWRTPSSVEGMWREAARQEIDLVGRLRPGVTRAQANAELTGLVRQLETERPADAPRGLVPVVQSFSDEVVGDVRPTMNALAGLVGLVLAVAIANGANLLLMRNQTRRSEFAIRLALGASRGRIAGQILTESLALALAAGAAGLALAWAVLPAVLALAPGDVPRLGSVRADLTVVLLAVVLTLATALLTGLAPAVSFGADLMSSVKAGGRGVLGSRSRRLRRGFVVAQIAFAVTAIAAAGLLTRTLLRLQATDTGVAADRLVFVELSVPSADHSDGARYAQFLDAAIDRLESLPSIAAATPINTLPFAGGWDVPQFTVEGQTRDRAAANPALNLESIFPNYFGTLNVPLIEGRPFSSADRQATQPVAIISEDVATRAWPGEQAVGKRLKWGSPSSDDAWMTVVGVARSTRYRDLTQPRPTIYRPAAQFLMSAQTLAVRTAAPVEHVATMAREQILELSASVQVVRVSSFGERLNGSLARPRFNAFLANAFGFTAMLLALAGLYAVMGTYVRERHRDIALRVVFGATPAAVRRLVLGEALALATVGAALGIAGAAGGAHLLRGMLYSVPPLDPASITGAAVLLVVTSMCAAYLPSRRAVRTDPMVALRSE